MQVCTSLQTDNHASTPSLSFFTGRLPFLPPNQQRQSTEGNNEESTSFKILKITIMKSNEFGVFCFGTQHSRCFSCSLIRCLVSCITAGAGCNNGPEEAWLPRGSEAATAGDGATLRH